MEDALRKAIQLRKENKPDEAFAVLLELLRSKPEDPMTNYQLAWTCDIMGKEREAVPYYEKAIANGLSDDDRQSAMLGLGSTYRALGEYENSLRVLKGA